MDAITFTIEQGREAIYSRGSVCRASFYDREQEQFYAGSSDVSVWDAIAWALVERELRILNGNRPAMARGPNETPAGARNSGDSRDRPATSAVAPKKPAAARRARARKH